MKITHTGISGTMESSDILITLAPAKSGIFIDLNSTVEKQFGSAIRSVITSTLKELHIDDAQVTAVDKGALDCTIRARLKAAAYRASESTEYKWEPRT